MEPYIECKSGTTYNETSNACEYSGISGWTPSLEYTSNSIQLILNFHKSGDELLPNQFYANIY